MIASKNLNIVLGGVGGQGILFATKILSEAALRSGVNILGSETHGMAQRGGSVVSHLKIGSTCGPLVSSGDAHILLSLEKNETYKNLHFLRPKGTCFANVPSPDFLAKSVLTYIKSKDISLYGINADEVALASGALVASNVIMLGLLSSWPGSPFSREDLLSVITDVGAKRFNEKNTEVFDKGHRMGKERYFAD